MSESDTLNSTRKDWEQRQRKEGNRPRSVLMKGLHEEINSAIDQWHRLVLASAFPAVMPDQGSCLDVGSGYGRLAPSAKALGLAPLYGLDFARGFCAEFARTQGPAVCASATSLPFRPKSFNNAYAVTALMYLTMEQAVDALLELDACLKPGSRVLLLEPSKEFNSFVRHFLPSKRRGALAVPGLSKLEFFSALPPGRWRLIESGGCPFLTIALPFLVVLRRFSRLFRYIRDTALKLDQRIGKRTVKSRSLSMYQWAVYETEAQPHASARLVARCTPENPNEQRS